MESPSAVKVGGLCGQLAVCYDHFAAFVAGIYRLPEACQRKKAFPGTKSPIYYIFETIGIIC